jgi:SAM-dependent methyltransferase
MRREPREQSDTPEVLPQADASSLVDVKRLETEVREMYRRVAREPNAPRHFQVGRDLALNLGYPRDLLDAIPGDAVASFAGVGYHLDLARLAPGDRVLDLGSGSGTDVFCAAMRVGPSGRVVGVDFTDQQVQKATRLRDEARLQHVEFVEASIDDLPFADRSFDVVLSNGVINLSPVFAEAARVLRPGGRLAVADIITGRALRDQTRRNVELWAACIAGAIPRGSYLAAIQAAGLSVGHVRRNDYEFTSKRALPACSRYAVESVSLVAVSNAN